MRLSREEEILVYCVHTLRVKKQAAVGGEGEKSRQCRPLGRKQEYKPPWKEELKKPFKAMQTR